MLKSIPAIEQDFKNSKIICKTYKNTKTVLVISMDMIKAVGSSIIDK